MGKLGDLLVVMAACIWAGGMMVALMVKFFGSSTFLIYMIGFVIIGTIIGGIWAYKMLQL